MGSKWWNSSVLDTEGKSFSSMMNKGLRKNALANTSNDKSFNEVFGSSFYNMPLRQQIETAYDYYDKPKNQNSGMKSYTLESKPMEFAGQMKEDSSNCHMTFDGQNLGLFKNGRLVDHLKGQSGQDGFQSAAFQNVKDKGPIPEGTYYADQSKGQTITPKDAVWGAISSVLQKTGVPVRGGKWQGGPVAWGVKRAWLRPDEKTNTYGRSGFSIHGGLIKGSAGCIDVPWQTGRVSNFLDDCQESVPVEVKYPKGL